MIIKLFPLTGDEVVEWNGRCLQRATFEEVQDIILESKQEPQVELIVHRNTRFVIIRPTMSNVYICFIMNLNVKFKEKNIIQFSLNF